MHLWMVLMQICDNPRCNCKALVDSGPAVDCAAPAGIVKAVPFLEMSEDDFDAVIAVNLKGVFLTCQTAAKQMVQQVSATQADLLVALCGVQA
jgi:NADP-dependent 3-hydroxy acid dehydrogenase YdfG